MARGYPDYRGVSIVAEVRERSNILFPSGVAVRTDDFDSVRVHYTAVVAGGGAVHHSIATSFSGEACCRLYTGVGPGAWASARYYIGDVTGSQLGVEFAFQCIHDEDLFFEVSVSRYDGANRSIGRVRYYIDEQRWEYYNAAGGYSILPGGSMNLYFGSFYWHIIKLKINTSTGYYNQLLIDNHVINMSTLPLNVAANATAERVEVYVRIETEAAAGKIMYIDNVSITREE